MHYPTYKLAVQADNKWCQVGEASNRPHHYDALRVTFDSIVQAAKAGHVTITGVRITSDDRPVDVWQTLQIRVGARFVENGGAIEIVDVTVYCGHPAHASTKIGYVVEGMPPAQFILSLDAFVRKFGSWEQVR